MFHLLSSSPSSTRDDGLLPPLSDSPDGDDASQVPSQRRHGASMFFQASANGTPPAPAEDPAEIQSSRPLHGAAQHAPVLPIGSARPAAGDGQRPPPAVSVESLAVEVQGMRRQFREIHRVAELLSGVPSALVELAQQLYEADAAFSPRRWLYAVLGVQEFALGRSLQSTLHCKFLDRLQVRPGATSRGHDQASVKVELECTYGALVDLVRFRRLSLSECTLRQCRASCASQLSSPRALLDALDVPAHVVPAVLLRCFSRKNGDKITRLLLEHHRAPDGAVFYVLGRDQERRTVSVAVRDSEDYDIVRNRHLHPLRQRTVANDDVSNIPAHAPCRLSWHGNMTSSRLETDAAMVSGRLSLVVPSTVIAGDGIELSNWLL